MSKGIVKPSDVLGKLTVESQMTGLSDKLKGIIDPGGTAFAKIRLGYVSAFDPATWTCSAMIGDQLTTIPSIPVLAHVQPMIEQAGLFAQTGGDGTSQYTLIGMLGQGSTGGAVARVRKVNDQTITNSSTITADNHLFFTAQSERTYIYEAQLYVRQNSTLDTMDFNVGLLLPSGSTYTIGGSGPATGIAGGSASLAAYDGQWRAVVGSVSGDKLAFGVEPALANGVYDYRTVSIVVKGVISMGATSGQCSIGWCQNIAATASTQVRAGSWLKVDATSELLP